MTPEPTLAEAPPETRSTAGMTTKVFVGSLWTLAGQVAPLAVSLVTTPFTIRMLGAEGYGVFILIGLIPTYLGFADFGMGMASTKFGSEAYAESDEKKEGRVVRTAAVISLCTSVPIAALLMIFAGYIISLFNVPAEFTSQAKFALRLASITFVINFLCGIFNTPHLARLRMDLNTLINATSRILGLMATPIVLYLGYGIVGAITVLLIASILNLTGHLLVSRHYLKELIKPEIDATLFRPFLKFGSGLVIATSAAMVVANAEKAIVPSIVSVEALAFYSVAFTLATMTTLFAQAMNQALIPAFAQLQGSEKKETLGNLFFRGLRYNLLIIFPIFFALILLSQPFFYIWAGPEFATNSSIPFYLILCGLFFNIPAYLPYSLIMAHGRSDLFAKLYFGEVVPYLALVFTFTHIWGIRGTAAAWSIRVIIDAILLFWIAKSISSLKFPIHELIVRLAPGIVLIAGLVITIPFYNVWWVLISVPIISLGLYSVLTLKFALQKEEVAYFWKRIRG